MGSARSVAGCINERSMSSNLAVLIDYENIGIEPIADLLKKVTGNGRVVICRAYSDWSGQAKHKDALLEIGIEPIHHFRPAKNKRNSSDIAMAVDGMEIAYSRPVDTFVIASSDSDFIPLVRKLRSMGKIVIGAGRGSIAPEGLRNLYDRFIDLESAINFNSSTGTQKAGKPSPNTHADWDKKIDKVWNDRKASSIPGPQAASDAAKILAVPKLSSSKYSTLQGLLDNSTLLKSRWRRDANTINKIT